jgi:penicillin-binding protein 2
MLAKRTSNRIDVLSILMILVFVALITRLGFLQVVQGKYYSKLADGNRIRLIPAMAPRGLFYDRHGVLMVSNRPGFTVSLLPITAPISDEVIVKLAGILNINPDEIRGKLKAHSDTFEPIRVKADVGQDVVTKIEERRAEFPGVDIEIQPIRNYLYKDLAAHVFGYVSEINDDELKKLSSEGYKAGDIIGKYGLEKFYDKELRGIDGGEQVEVDAAGRPVNELGKKETVPGDNLGLTIDYRIQKAAEEAVDQQLQYLQTKTRFVNAKAAAVVVMDPQTGEILAMVSRPDFDPNLFATGISVKDWKNISDNPFHPMDNKAISGEYPPGSTFKIITSAAALELGKVTPEEKIFDSGHHWLIPKGNADGEALGWIDYNTALAKSDNVYFYEMGNRVGIDNLEKYARMFGLGDYTGIDLAGEANGLVANRRYKEKVYHEDWYLSETFDAAIGQGFQLATPLQIAMVMSEVANGGKRYRPYLVSKITAPNGTIVKEIGPQEMGRLEVSDKTMDIIRKGLRSVTMDGGTAADVFKGFPIAVAGKTGTAENSHGTDHSWFVCYAPFDNPRIVVSVIVEQGGYGNDAAVPIAKKILEAFFNLNQAKHDTGVVARPQTSI